MRVKRLVFANQLRGIAALLVACSHLIGVFWVLRRFVAEATFSPVQGGANPALVNLISYQWFEFGPFGVALFFLISGLVIPFSLEKHTRWTFLLARILRIYPTFIVALLFEMLVLYGASRYWHRPFAFDARMILTNGLLINNLTGYPVVDFVNWTLSIEIKFYLLIMIVATSIKNGKLSVLFGIAAAITLANFLIARHFDGLHITQSTPVLSTFSLESPYIIFMFIGVLFNFHESKYYGSVKLVATILVMSALFLTCWRLGTLSPEYPVVTVNYLYGIIIFGTLYAGRNYIKENRIIDFMASISFPFYLIHAVIGFTVMKILMVSLRFNYYLALVCAVFVITGLALLLHRTLELGTIAMGRRLVRRSPRLVPVQDNLAASKR